MAKSRRVADRYPSRKGHLGLTPDLHVVALGSCLVEMTPQETGRDLISADEYVALPSGAASNFAIALARLGVKTGFITRVGDDELGQWLLRKLHGFGVVTEGLARRVAGQLTPVSFCWMDRAGEKRFYFYRFASHCDPMGALQADELGRETVGRGELFDFSEATVRKQPLRDVALEAARTARAAGRRVVYAVNYRPSSWEEPVEEMVGVQQQALGLADIAVMNREEALLLTGTQTPTEAVAAIAELGPELIAITDGGEGAYVYGEGELNFVPPRRVEVAYDIGAGDTFHAGLVAAYLAGLSPERIGRTAADAAALRISRSADMESLPTWEEVVELSEQPL